MSGRIDPELPEFILFGVFTRTQPFFSKVFWAFGFGVGRYNQLE